MVGSLDGDEKAFLELATELRKLGVVRVETEKFVAQWEGAPEPKPGERPRPVNDEERRELDHLRAAMRREEEAMSAS